MFSSSEAGYWRWPSVRRIRNRPNSRPSSKELPTHESPGPRRTSSTNAENGGRYTIAKPSPRGSTLNVQPIRDPTRVSPCAPSMRFKTPTIGGSKPPVRSTCQRPSRPDGVPSEPRAWLSGGSLLDESIPIASSLSLQFNAFRLPRRGRWQTSAPRSRTTLGKGSASPTYFGPFSSGTESAWCRNSASLGKRVSRQSVGCGPEGSGRSHDRVANLLAQLPEGMEDAGHLHQNTRGH